MSNKENKMDVDDGNKQEEKDENMQEDEVRYR
jgi:hypothetical protein